VQRDLLPLIEERSLVQHGNVNTDYILFVRRAPTRSNPVTCYRNCKGRSRFVSGERTHGG
jgi:ATP-dependent protease HslVU (ClpYQ) ATPase subunit